jgi:cell division transport system permease protein
MTRLAWFVREAWRGLWFHRAATWTALVSAIGAFLVLGVFLLFTANVQRALTGLGDRREVVIYLRDYAPDAAKDSLVARVDSLYGAATYVSREQAWADFSTQLGGSDLLEAVGQNPLPASIRVKLRPEYESFAATERMADDVASSRIVETVRFGGEWVRRLDEFVATLRWIDLVVGLVVALAVLFIVGNAIRLTFLARRETLRILALVGAGDGFVFTPLVLEGVIAAAFGALVAIGLVQLGASLLNGKPVDLVMLPWSWAAAFVGGAALLGFLGGLAALVPLTRKH